MFNYVSGWLARGALRGLHSGNHHPGPVRSAAAPCSCLHGAADAVRHDACVEQSHAAFCHAEMTMVRQSRHGASWQLPSLVVMTTTSASALATTSGRWVADRQGCSPFNTCTGLLLRLARHQAQKVVNALVYTFVQAKLGKLAEIPTLSMFGRADECVPPAINAHALRDKMAAVLKHPLSQALVIEGAGHALEGHEQEAVNIMISFVKSIAS